MASYHIKIPFTPKAKASVRMGMYGAYNPSRRGMSQVKEFVRSDLRENWPDFCKLSGPLLMVVRFRIPSPQSPPLHRRLRFHNLPHAKKPDGDNLEKFLNDCLTGLVWEDDSHISWLLRSKTMTTAKEGETLLFVTEIENKPMSCCDMWDYIKDHIMLGDYEGYTKNSQQNAKSVCSVQDAESDD